MQVDSSTCVQCGVAIQRRGKQGPLPRYCSPACKQAFRRGVPQELRRTLFPRAYREMACQACGEIFGTLRIAQRFCSRACGVGRPRLTLEERSCKGCRATFTVKITSDKAFCSAACAARSRGNRTTSICKGCGATFIPKRAVHSTYCTRECAYAHKAAQPPEPIVERPCSVCGMAFLPKRRHGRICSNACRAEDLRKQTKATYYAKAVAVPPTQETRQCVECGSDFLVILGIGSGRGKRGSFCSERCGMRNHKRNRKKRIRAAFVSNVSLDAIYQRDGGRCQLCGKKVDRSLVWPDLMSVSIDHIIPLSLGGTHEPLNVQLAHFICNSRKSNTGASQLRML